MMHFEPGEIRKKPELEGYLKTAARKRLALFESYRRGEKIEPSPHFSPGMKKGLCPAL